MVDIGDGLESVLYAMAYDTPGELGMIEKEMSVFANGRSRAVRIPSEIDLPGDRVVWKQDDDGTITLRPLGSKHSLSAVLDELAERRLDDRDIEAIDAMDGIVDRAFRDDRLDHSAAVSGGGDT